MVNGCFLLLHHHCLFGLFEVSTVGADVLLTWKSAVFMDGINRVLPPMPPMPPRLPCSFLVVVSFQGCEGVLVCCLWLLL